MRAPIGWLRDFVDLPADSQAIADRLAQIGFPVEEIFKRPTLSGILIGKIATLERHPNADRLLVATVDVGNDRRLNVATAATNVAVDQTIAVATIGAQLPDVRIERRKMRGFESEGMMISADELGLPAEWFEDGILQLGGGAKLGDDVVESLRLQDDVLDVEITANRPDAMSIFGLARELAAAYRVPLRSPAGIASPPLGGVDSQGVQITLESKDCARFVAQRFSNIRVGVSPLWMRIRLALAGQRPISNVVDVSNYVMLEIGQPLHFYDAARISGRHLIVRDAREGEEMTTLDGTKYKLSPSHLVIADDDGAQGLAGLKGGQETEVTAQTSSIVLEAANFSGARVRRMSVALGLRTEASARHEKTLAPILTDFGATRAARLLADEGARVHPAHVVGAPIAELPPIEFPVREVKRLLGFALSSEQIAQNLEPLGFAVKRRSSDSLDIVAPLWRRDVSVAADVVEEVARMTGYDNVPAEIPALGTRDIPSTDYLLERSAAEVLRSLGYAEIVSYSLHGPRVREKFAQSGLAPHLPLAEVLNPLSEDQRYLRAGLEPGFLDYLARARDPMKIFEIGHTFAPSEPIDERAIVGWAFTAPAREEPPWSDTQFRKLKGHAEALVQQLTGRKPEVRPVELLGFHPGKTAALLIDERQVGHIGAIDPRLVNAYELRWLAYAASIDLRKLPPKVTARFLAPSRFPTVQRDLALVVPLEVSAADVESSIAAAGGARCKAVQVFDEYRGPQAGAGRKSLAVHLALGRDDATMTDAQADQLVQDVLKSLHQRFGATLRR